MYYPHENDFDNPRDWRWLKTTFLSVFVAVVLSAVATATTVLWTERTRPAGSAGTYDPTAAQQVPEPAKLGSSALDKPAAEIQNDPGLQKLLHQFIARTPAEFGIYIENLQTSQTAAHRLDEIFPAHQLIYLFIAHEILRELDTGLLTPRQSAGEASQLSIQQCLTQMLTTNHPACTADLGNILGWQRRDSELARLGFDSTTLAREQAATSARDLAKFYKNLAEGRHLSAASRATMLGWLRNQPGGNRLAYGLPQLTKTAHFPSDGDIYFHDGGIVYSFGGDYILVMLSGRWSQAEADQQLGELSQKVYGYFNN